MTPKERRLFNKLAGFLRRNCQLVADARDSNAPWTLLQELDNYTEPRARARGVRPRHGRDWGTK